MEKQNKTFISYSKKDEDFAKALARELKIEGFSVWLDVMDIPAGTRWAYEVDKALAACRIFLVILTPSSLASEHVLDEIEYAIDNGHAFLPVLLEDCTIPLRLRRFKYADFRGRNFYDGVNDVMLLLQQIMGDKTEAAPSGLQNQNVMETSDNVIKRIFEGVVELKSRVNRKADHMTFISYSRVDKDFVSRLVRELKMDNFSVWVDFFDIRPGVPWDNEIQRGLAACEFFMIIMTPAAVESENVKDEIGYAFKCDKRFIPIMLEKCDIPLRLHRLQYVDFTNKTFDEGVQQIKCLMRSLVE